MQCSPFARFAGLRLHLHPVSKTVRAASASSSTRRHAEATPTAFIAHAMLEAPVVAVAEKHTADLIGPPDPLSNLRPIVRTRRLRETRLQQTLRELQDATQAWNQRFWADHNARFIQQRREFVQQKHAAKGCTDALSAEEMSEFYKQFLDDNWQNHLQYNVAWYKHNLHILWLNVQSCLPPSLHYLRSIYTGMHRQCN